MNSNSYFEIGSSHQVCQDYALSGTFNGMHYCIVSDGCSSAKHSEIGAQVLCHVAQYSLQLYYNLFLEKVSRSMIANLLANSIFRRADEIRKLYPIDRDALQATLLIALVVEDKAWVFGWGDGYVIQQGFDKQTILKIEYPKTNAPFYLSTNREAYIAKFGEGHIVKITSKVNPDLFGLDEIVVSEYPFDKSYYESFVIAPGDMITIATDGVDQYLDKNKKPIADSVILPMLLDYPSTEGVFVERTMNFLKKDLTRKGWSHSDDIGIATLVA